MQKKIILIAITIATLAIIRQFQDDSPEEYYLIGGTTMGTISYEVKYLADENQNFQEEIDQILIDFNQSLSTYIPSSEVSKFNREDSITYSSPFLFGILRMSKMIFEESNGAYDPTVGPLVNAWGFGPQKKTFLDSTTVDSLLRMVDFEMIQFDSLKATKPNGSYLDFSASAKGFGLDVIADFLINNGITNYMIEIGGEIRCQGHNQNGTIWKIGIEKPAMQAAIGDLFATVFVKNQSLATSGNYRNYYQSEGQIIAHTISPFTGYHISHNLLSASIIAPNCTMADGYATACMVMGLEKSIEMIERLEELEGFFIFSGDDGVLSSYSTPGIRKQVEIVQ